MARGGPGSGQRWQSAWHRGAHGDIRTEEFTWNGGLNQQWELFGTGLYSVAPQSPGAFALTIKGDQDWSGENDAITVGTSGGGVTATVNGQMGRVTPESLGAGLGVGGGREPLPPLGRLRRLPPGLIERDDPGAGLGKLRRLVRGGPRRGPLNCNGRAQGRDNIFSTGPRDRRAGWRVPR